MSTSLIISFIIYLSFLFWGGFSLGKRLLSQEGGGRFKSWLVTLNNHASDMSAWGLMAFPAIFFVAGFHKIWVAIGMVTALFVNWHFIAPRLYAQTSNLQSKTLAAFFEMRFNDQTHVLRILTVVVTVFFLSIFAAAGLVGMGYLFEGVLGINYYSGLIVSSLMVFAYISFKGYMAAAHMGFFQGVLLLLTIVIVPIVAFLTMDGWDSVTFHANNKSISLSMLPELTFDGSFILATLIACGLGYFGQPQMITKFLNLKDPKIFPKAKFLEVFWQVMVLSSGAFVGLLGISFLSDLQNPELVFIEMAKNVIFAPIAELFLCAASVAILSAVVSQVMTCGSALSDDLVGHILNKKGEQNSKIAKLCVGFAICMALFAAQLKPVSVITFIQYAWTGLGCSFGPLVIAAAYSKIVNRSGAIAGILSGSLISGIWPLMNGFITPYVIPAMLPAFILSFISIHLVSFVSKHEMVSSTPYGLSGTKSIR